MQLTQLTSFSNYFSENLLNKKSLLKNTPQQINSVGSGVYELTDVNSYSQKSKSVYFFSTFQGTNAVISTFDLNDALQTTIPFNGNYNFQFSLMNQTQYGDALPIKLSLNVFVNNNLQYTFDRTFNFQNFVTDQLYTFAQSFDLSEGDVVNFNFIIDCDYPGSPAPTLKLYFSGFKLEFENKGFSLPTIYTLPYIPNCVYNKRTDFTNTQNIVENTDTDFAFTGILENNTTDLILLTNGLIKPLYENDTLSVDFSFSFVTPSGSNKFVDLFLKSDENIIVGKSFSLLKNVGELDYISGCFNLPVNDLLLNTGLKLVINSNHNLTIENRLLSVIENINL